MTSSAAHPGNLILSILKQFQAQGLPYVYLRNYEALPEVLGNDVDLLIPRGATPRALALISKISDEWGWKIIRRVPFSPLSVFLGSGSGDEIIHIDLFERLEWHFVPLAKPEKILIQREWNGLVFVCDPATEACLNLLTRLIYAGVVREKHRVQWVEAQTQVGAPAMESVLADWVGPRIAASLMLCLTRQDWPGVLRLQGRLRRVLVGRAIASRLGETLRAALAFLARGMERLFRPPGPFLVLEGADGSGKSRAISALLPFLVRFTGKNNPVVFAWKPWPGHFRRPEHGSPAAPQNPRARPTRHPLRGVFYLGYHWITLWLGHLFWLRPVRAMNRAVVADRFGYNFFADPQRLRLRLPAFLLRAAARLLPRPDLVFCLAADPAVIHARKQELSAQEIETHQARLRELADRDHRFVFLDAGLPPHDIDERIRQTILTWAEASEAGRPGNHR